MHPSSDPSPLAERKLVITRYTARARHGSREACENHAAMGFESGWNKAFDQLVELMF